METKQEQNKISFTEQNPELIKDATLFKLVLTPLELFTLKYFLSNIHPVNIRQVYSHAIEVLFLLCFGDKENYPEMKNTYYINFFQQLISSDYGLICLDFKIRRKEFKEVYTNKNNISITDFKKAQLEKLKKYKAKVPSYDKFHKIFERFERIGIIYKRAKEGNIILYGLNPKFYNLFKDKTEEIINL